MTNASRSIYPVNALLADSSHIVQDIVYLVARECLYHALDLIKGESFSGNQGPHEPRGWQEPSPPSSMDRDAGRAVRLSALSVDTHFSSRSERFFAFRCEAQSLPASYISGTGVPNVCRYSLHTPFHSEVSIPLRHQYVTTSVDTACPSIFYFIDDF